MHTSSSNYYTSATPLRRPARFLVQARQLTDELGSVPLATRELFERANIRVEVVGDTDRWDEGGGLLLAGDHQNKIEFAPLLDILGRTTDRRVHFVQKPFSINARTLASLGTQAADMSLPVIPGSLARDRRDVVNRDLGWRITQYRRLPTQEQLSNLNRRTVRCAALMLELGHVVTLYPAGGVVDAVVSPWRRGLGSVIKLLPAGIRPDVQVVLFRFDPFPAYRLIWSLRLQSLGITPPPLTLTMRIGVQGTVAELFGDAGLVDRLDAAQLTQLLRRLFVGCFSNVRDLPEVADEVARIGYRP
jgi:hypothetical protein